MAKFDTALFLNLLSDDCAAFEAKGEQFSADPSKLGPLLMTAANIFEEQERILKDALLRATFAEQERRLKSAQLREATLQLSESAK